MKLPWNKDADTPGDAGDAATTNEAPGAVPDPTEDAALPKGHTPKKGRPTPRRNDVERQAGTRRAHYDAPLTPKEARERRKAEKASMTKEEFKEKKRRQREESASARKKANERMMAGDPNYLLPRDQGREKLFVRNYVDAHRYAMNMFLPIALIVVLVMIVGMQAPELANLVSLVMLFVIVLLIIEGYVLGRKVNKLVDERFPERAFGRWTIGFYAFTRATMVRRMRTPAPQVNIGDPV
ncbi:DUF3043 domain-containing protein [uncultured Corynebacterium sp.]|uniref:DUF3043 domain-containing protein n=1 Tax=uncultured Corynebacterium sp. TaxID=159447 RepID=UPI0025D004EE|nr:DUF3043 domain-containing protein [uncultured Corynebacterium sp.]